MGNFKFVPVDYMEGAMQRYVEHGANPGHFLMALLSNDLKETYARADNINALKIQEWVTFCYSEIPASSWGSARAVKEWMAHSGLDGLRMKTQHSIRP